MTPATFHLYKRQFPRYYLSAFLVLVTLTCLSACSIINRDQETAVRLGHDILLQGEGRLVCSGLCAERGQCGTIRDRGNVVLGGRAEAKTFAHDVYLPAGSQVQIATAQSFPVQQLSGGDPFLINFYAVIIPGGEAGWVAGWCLAEAPNAQ